MARLVRAATPLSVLCAVPQGVCAQQNNNMCNQQQKLQCALLVQKAPQIGSRAGIAVGELHARGADACRNGTCERGRAFVHHVGDIDVATNPVEQGDDDVALVADVGVVVRIKRLRGQW